MKKRLSQFIAIFWVLGCMLSSCQSLKILQANRKITKNLKSEIFTSQFTGLVIYNPSTNEYLYDQNGGLYFTPASNTKILTVLACLETFGDSIPAFLSYQFMDTLTLQPLGDPTLLHPDFEVQPAFDVMNNNHVRMHYPGDPLNAFGNGWMWDDYQYSDQPQLSWMPLYGNMVRVIKEDSLEVIPTFFEEYVNLYIGEKPGDLVYRDLKYNLFNVWMESVISTFEREIPFDYSKELALELLRDTLSKSIVMIDSLDKGLYDTLYNQATTPVLTLMMQRSDNFLAEQLLILSGRISGYRNPNAYRQYLLSKWGFPNEVQWVDGSGLSRYNMINPYTLIKALNKIYTTNKWSTIERIFPNGGVSGTIKNWYGGKSTYVFAKTGTLRNNHCLSGFIKTNSGKTLIFSLMNNHFTRPTSEVKQEMQKLLETIRDRY